MEIMRIYQVFSYSLHRMGMDIKTSLWAGLAFGSAVWIALFILQGIGLFVMAKKQNVGSAGLAFVPFANVFLMGKLAGESNAFGKKIKNLKVYVCISQIIVTVICFLTIAAEMYLYLTYGLPSKNAQEMPMDSPYWPGLTGTAYKISRFYEISTFLISIFGLIFEILMFLLIVGIIKKYSPSNYSILGALTLFVPISKYILIFVLRKRKAIDFDAYMRARREAFLKQQQQYRNMYGNPYNPYGGNYANPNGTPPPSQENKKPEDPFEEFSSKNTQTGGNSSQDSSDDFFH
jgi:hypothetical protein